MKTTFKRATALLLSLLMVFSVCSTALVVYAADDEKELNYVSLGASNVNGYGMHGYLSEEVYEYPLLKETANIYGYKQDTPGSYPVLIKEHLENKGYTVNLSQMAISSMRAEEVRFLLDDSYKGDAYTDWRFCDIPGYDARNSQNWFYLAGKLEWEAQGNSGIPTQEQAVEALKAAYKKAIAEADFITVDIGINNFGVYASNQIVSNMYENDMNTIDPELAAIYAEGKAYVMEVLQEEAGDLLTAMPVESLNHMADTMAYALVGFCLSFDAVMEQIYTLNPDATVAVVSIQNLMYGLKASMEGLNLPFGDIFGVLVNAANVYTATVSPYCNKYVYADVRQEGHVEFFMDEILAYNGDPSTLSQDMKDCFDVYDNDLYIKTRVQQLFAKLLASNGELVISDKAPNGADIAGNLEHFAVAYQNQWLSVKSYGDTLNSFLKAGVSGDLEDTPFEDYFALYYRALTTAYDVMAEIMQAGVAIDTLDASSFGQQFGPVEDALLGAFFGTLEDAVTKSADPTFKFDLNEYYPEGIYKTLAEEIGQPEGFVNTVAAMGIRTGIGNSFFGHPNGNGQIQLKNAIISALKNETSGSEVVLYEALYLITEYYDEAYAYAYDYAEQSGYIAAAIGAIENAEAAVNNIAIPFPTATTEAFVAQAYVLKAEIAETLAQAKAFILAADELDQETLDALLALLGSAAEDLNDMAALLNQAAADVNTLAIIPAINAAYNELVNNVIPTVKSMLEQAVIEGTKKFVELAKTALGDLADAAVKAAIKFAPELDAMLYDYFYNNPEEVIAFFAEYGYIIAELAEKYGDEALGVAAYVLVTYGEDIAKFFMENYETIFEGIVAWADKYGERTIEMIQVYAEATGLCDAVRAEIAALEEKLAGLKAQLDYQLKELEEKLGVQLEVLKAQLESLKRELLIAAEPYKQAILAEIAKVEALIAEIEAKIEQVKALIAEIEAKIIEIQNQIAELNARLQNLIYAIQNLDEALKYLAYAGLEAATPMIQQALNGVAYAVSQLVGFVSEEAAKALDALIEQAKAFLDEAFYNATHADYAIDNTSSHVALGDNTMTAQLFGQYVQSIVNGSDVYYTYKTTDLTSAGSKISALPVVLAENLETIVAADLITIGYGYDALAEETVNLLFDLILLGTAKVDYNIDLVAKVGPEAAAEIEKIVANVYATLIQNNLGITLNKGGIPVADAVVIAMKYFAYYAAEYAVYMPQAVYAIHEINPEALIMINAISNPIAGASIAVALPEMGLDVEIAFGDYLNYVCDAIYLETAVLAAINEKVVFVPATGIETTFTNKTVSFNGLSDLVDLLMNYETVMAEMFNIETTVNGNVAVVNKMADALNITVEHSALLGDVNGDGVVSITDAVLVLRFDAQLPDVVIDLSVADVDGDGMINITDAVWILRYDALLVDKLPASK